DVASGRAFLAVQAAHVAVDEGPDPDFLTGVRITGEELADDAEFVSGAAVNQQNFAGFAVFYDGRCAGHGVASGVVAEFLLPHHLAGVLVQCHHAGIEGADVDLVAVDCGATVDHVAARTDVVGQAVRIAPQALAGTRIQSEHSGVGAGHVDHAVVNDGLGFLTALFFVTEREGPGRGQFENVVLVYLGQRAPALGVGAKPVLQDVFSGDVVIGDVFPGDVLGLNEAAQSEAAG